MAWGTYMLRKSFVLVFIRLRVKARHHEEAAMKPRGARTLYAAQTVCVGFLSSPGEGAAS
jgi:hypothetical protein